MFTFRVYINRSEYKRVYTVLEKLRVKTFTYHRFTFHINHLLGYHDNSSAAYNRGSMVAYIRYVYYYTMSFKLYILS